MTNSNFEKKDYQQELTNKFIARIEEIIANEEKGIKWEKPFFSCNELPYNYLTKDKYSGGNIIGLLSEEYADPR